ELFQKNKKIEHTYKDDGEYTVKAQLINSDGCAVERTLSQKIKIGLQDIEIKPGGYTECLPSSRIFSLEENLEDPVQSYTWTFADSAGVIYTTDAVNKQFSDPGLFLVRAVVYTTRGCRFEDTCEVSVGNRYKPDFELLQRDYCGRDVMKYLNTTHDSIKKIK